MNTQVREKMVVAGISVAAAVFLTVAKLTIGIWTGSLGILAEAAHSGLDLAAAIVTFFAVRVSDRPADESHLYGHGKVENLSALAETLLLLLTCLWIIYEAVERLFFETVEVDPSLWAFLVMGVSIVVDFSRSRALGRVARKYKSQALEADALHFSTDIWSSAVVIIGLALVRFGERRGGDNALFERADAVAALVVAGIVIFVSVRLGRRAIDALLDKAPQGLANRLSQSVEMDVSGVQRVTRTRVRDAGNRVFVDMNVDVPRHLSVEESHDITQRAQEVVQRLAPDADVLIHTEPVAEREGIFEKIQSVARQERVSVHNVTTHWTERGMWIDLDLEVDPDSSFEVAHKKATDLESRLSLELIRSDGAIPIAEINAHIEPRAEESVIGITLSIKEAVGYVRRIGEVARELPHAHDCHRIELHRVRGKVYLSFHMAIDAGTPMADVHGIAEDMEARLRREFPELGRVVIHTEPFPAEH